MASTAHHLSSITLRTVTGADVTIDFTTPGDGRVLPRGVAKRDGKTVVEGWVDPPHAIDRRIPAMSQFPAAATQYARIADKGFLPLDGATATALSAAIKVAEAAATSIRADRDATRTADLRAACEVRRVLCVSHAYAEYQLTEAAAAETLGHTKVGLPGVPRIKVSWQCPSMRAIQARSETWGSFNGHDNTLYAISDADWHLLVAEQADLERSREERRQAEESELLAIVVPPEAVTAYNRYGGHYDTAWDNGDEQAAALINIYRAAIEAQGLGYRRFRPEDGEINPPGA